MPVWTECPAQYANLFFLDALVSGVRAALMLDTGAGRTVLSRSLAEEAGARFAGAARGGNNVGQVLEAQTARVEALEFGGVALEGLEALVLPDEVFRFEPDDRGNAFPARGFLGWDAISKVRWEVDPEHRRCRVGLSRAGAGLHNLSWDGFPVIRARWNGQEVLLGFDSGHTGTLLSGWWRNKLPGCRSAREQITGVGGGAEERVLIAPRLMLELGGKAIALEDVPILERDIYGSGEGLTGLLGVDAVMGVRWTLDFAGGSFELE
jgi:hypothetical protein